MIPPFQSHSETSRLAALSMYDKATGLQRAIVEWLDAKGGMTDEEIQMWTGIPPSTERPRRVELCALGIVRDSGQRRRTASGRTATVWELVPDANC